ncbi:MAG: alpha-D-ribose 1-methylphosphonate 5-triphosphate diphosphatase [Pseudomonadota bacterium]
MATKIEGATVILPDDVVETDVLIADGLIAEVGGSSPGDKTIDARGRILAPAMIDIHGDAFERQIMPRPRVYFPLEAALLETDRQLAANGITTAYHAVTLSWEPGLRCVERGEEMIDTLAALTPRLTVENRIQLRWETFASEAMPLITRALEAPLCPSVAFNDHTSMSMRDPSEPVQARLFEHNPAFKLGDPNDLHFRSLQKSTAQRAGLSEDAYIDLLTKTYDRRPDVPGWIADIAAKARARGAPMLSHDDTQLETRDFFRSQGARIAEFPMSLEVAQAARDAGDHIAFGAPNVVRGGSHIGSPNAADMVEAGLCEMLASDYFYPAMLAAVARLHAEKRAPLEKIWSLVSNGPAAAHGLNDRGRIEIGKRADLVLIDWPEQAVGTNPTPAIKQTLCKGKTAYLADAAG